MRTIAPMTFSYWILRALITGVVLASAVGKSLDLAGFAEVLATYQIVPAGWLWPLAWLVIGVEWVLVLWLLSGWLESWSRSPGLRGTQSELCGLDDGIAAARARYSKLWVLRPLLSSATALVLPA